LISEYPPMPAPGPPSLTPSVDTVFEAPSGAPGSTMWSPTLATQAPKAAIICSRASADAGGPPPPWEVIKYVGMEPPSVWADGQNNGRHLTSASGLVSQAPPSSRSTGRFAVPYE